jgi:hypothetical protein
MTTSDGWRHLVAGCHRIAYHSGLLVDQLLVVMSRCGPPGSKRSDHAMMQRPARVRLEAANDNFLMRRALARSAQDLLRMPFISRRQDQLVPPAEPLRIGFRPLLIVAFSGLILVALCGAFLLGLAFVGLLAGAVAGIDLVRRHFWRPARLVALDRPMVG